MRRDANPCRTLVARGSQTRQVRVLQVADPAVDHFERVRRRPTAKVHALDERDRQASERRVPCGARAEDPAADDDEVELTIGQCSKVPDHWFTSILALTSILARDTSAPFRARLERTSPTA